MIQLYLAALKNITSFVYATVADRTIKTCSTRWQQMLIETNKSGSQKKLFVCFYWFPASVSVLCSTKQAQGLTLRECILDTHSVINLSGKSIKISVCVMSTTVGIYTVMKLWRQTTLTLHSPPSVLQLSVGPWLRRGSDGNRLHSQVFLQSSAGPVAHLQPRQRQQDQVRFPLNFFCWTKEWEHN